ncbi:MAG TPA: BrnT family toxin [Candidatus Bathyarchaeia archaeon]|nr:BrnT family toxin [Candidatus Bathyarchaeia archaeon]
MFSWDARKARRNLKKHRVSFEEAATVFADPEALEWEDALHSETETRLKRLGCSTFGRILILVYTLRRATNEQETIRIISARRASPKEREAYFG